jgi:hypothetical protein
MDEFELMSDAKYKQYVKQVDNALKGFEYTSEWADLVNALGKLNKVSNRFQSVYQSFSDHFHSLVSISVTHSL